MFIKRFTVLKEGGNSGRQSSDEKIGVHMDLQGWVKVDELIIGKKYRMLY